MKFFRSLLGDPVGVGMVCLMVVLNLSVFGLPQEQRADMHIAMAAMSIMGLACPWCFYTAFQIREENRDLERTALKKLAEEIVARCKDDTAFQIREEQNKRRKP